MYDITVSQIVHVYYAESKDWNREYFRPRFYDGIVLFTEGEIEYHFANKNVVARKGDILYLPGNLAYSGIRHTDTVAFFVLDFKCASEREMEQLSAPFTVSSPNYELCFHKFAKLVTMWNKQPIDAVFQVKSFVYQMLCELFRTEQEKQRTTVTEEILDYVVENMVNPSLSVEELHKRFFLSESQLRRKFVKATGMTPNEYILTLRLNRAKSELIYTKKQIKQIALECGFHSQYYFSRCFSQNCGISPKEYRKKYL